jgi:CRP-like cAMP-binding protein
VWFLRKTQFYFSASLSYNVRAQSGEALYDDEKSETMERGLFFIEVGILKVERDTGNGNTATRRGCVFKSGSSSSLGQLAGEPMTGIHDLSFTGKLDENPAASESQTFRLARLGVGWVAGTMEFFQKRPRPGKEVALDYCKLHYLPFSKIQEVEAEDPGLLLELYKLLSYLMAQRQEATIGQLATLHSIMSSPAR